MLASCKLFEKGGQYSQPEIDWYTEQMKEIDELLTQSKQEKETQLNEIKEWLEKMLTEPFEKFEEEYTNEKQNLFFDYEFLLFEYLIVEKH